MFHYTNKDDLHQENAKIKQVLTENGYQESIISKVFKRVTNNHRLPQSQQVTRVTDIEEEEIRMSINWLWHILRSHKITSIFYTFHKLYCKSKDPEATKDKNKIVYQIGCSNCEAVCSSESNRPFKAQSEECKKSVRNCNCDKSEIGKHCWEAEQNFNWGQKKVIDRENRLILREIKETIHSLKNPNDIDKIPYMLREIWLPNLR